MLVQPDFLSRVLSASDHCSYIYGRMLLPFAFDESDAVVRFQKMLGEFPHLTREYRDGRFDGTPLLPPVICWSDSMPSGNIGPLSPQHVGRICFFQYWNGDKESRLDFYIRHTHADAYLGSEIVRNFLGGEKDAELRGNLMRNQPSWSLADTLNGIGATLLVIVTLIWRALTQKPRHLSRQRTLTLKPIDRAKAKLIAKESGGTINSVVCSILLSTHAKIKPDRAPVISIPVLVDASGRHANSVGAGFLLGSTAKHDFSETSAATFRWLKQSPVPLIFRGGLGLAPERFSKGVTRYLGPHTDYVYSCVPSRPIKTEKGIALLTDASVSPFPAPTAVLAFPVGKDMRTRLSTTDPELDLEKFGEAWAQACNEILR